MINLPKKIILIIFILSGTFLFAPNVFAQADPLIVDFQNSPLFNEGDIKPCDITQKWIKVTNYSGETLDISIKATDFLSPIPADDLSRVMVINIKEGANALYGPKTLAEFYLENGVNLGNIANGAMLQYDITISISCDEGNEWQQKRTGFNIEINGSGDNTTDEGIGGDGGLFSASTTTGGGGHLVTCGDNIRELDEECDDGNTINGDGCSSICKIETVAGAAVEFSEEEGEVLGESTLLPETGGGLFQRITRKIGLSSKGLFDYEINILFAGIFALMMIGLVIIRKVVLK